MILPRGPQGEVDVLSTQQTLQPTDSSPSLWTILTSETSGDSSAYWSSLIGIATAIIGNILISFALNIQRYAHIRIARKQEEAAEARRKSVSRRESTVNSPRNSFSYGTHDAPLTETPALGIMNPRGPRLGKPALQTTPVRSSEERHHHERRSGESAQAVRFADHPQEAQPLITSFDEPRGSLDDDTAGDDTATEGSHGSHGTDGTLRPHEKAAGKSPSSNYLKSPYWWAGIVTMTIGEAGNFLAYGFAPASIVSPLGVVSLISNCLIAPLLLKEPFRKRDLLGVLVSVAGAVIVVMSATSSNPKLGPGKIWHLIATWEFGLYLGLTVVLTVVLMVLSPRYGKRFILIDLGIVGLCGGYTVLSTKGVASLISNEVFKILTFPVTYLLVFVLVATAVLQIRYVNLALQRFNSTQVIPVQFVLFTICVIIGSAVLYRDFEKTSRKEASEFLGGCLLTFIGVWLITSQRSSPSGEDASTAGDFQPIRLVDEETTPQGTTYRDETPITSPIRSPIHSHARPHRDSDVSDVPSPLVSNPWVSTPSIPGSPNSPEQRPAGAVGLPATTSAPILPSEALLLEPDPEDSRSPPPPDTHQTSRRSASFSVDLGQPDTPGVPLQTPTGTPRQSRDLERVGEEGQEGPPTHIPGVGLVPSPFTTPMSGSLSAVVADSLRRGFRGKIHLRGGSGGRDRLAEIFSEEGRAGSSGDLPSPTQERSQQTSARKRSLSASLGDWLAGRSSHDVVDRRDHSSGSGAGGS